MKLTKLELTRHEEAVALLKKDRLNEDDALFVMKYWYPGATNITGNQVYLTPVGIAAGAALMHGGGGRVLDACAGIGTLAWHLCSHDGIELTCVEINPDFVEIGKKLVPQANWICGNIFDIVPELPIFDSAISNPPYGRVRGLTPPGNFKGEVHMAVMELLLKHTKQGATLILPRGCDNEEDLPADQRRPNDSYGKFKELYPLADIIPTSLDHNYIDPDEPECWRFRGTNLRVRVVNLEFPNHARNPYLPTTKEVEPDQTTLTPTAAEPTEEPHVEPRNGVQQELFKAAA